MTFPPASVVPFMLTHDCQQLNMINVLWSFSVTLLWPPLSTCSWTVIVFNTVRVSFQLHPVSLLLQLVTTVLCFSWTPPPQVWPHWISPLLFLQPQPQCFLLVCVRTCPSKSQSYWLFPLDASNLKGDSVACVSKSYETPHCKQARSALTHFSVFSIFPLAGFRRNEEMRAMEVLPILKEKVAFLSGKIMCVYDGMSLVCCSDQGKKANATWSTVLNLHVSTVWS